MRAASDLAAAVPDDEAGPNIRTVRDLTEAWPDDPGIVVSLLMHRVTLRTGESMYLPAGNVHAYLDGLGIELMAPSDNVLRGGLTPKHVDVPELLHVLDFTAHRPRSSSPSTWHPASTGSPRTASGSHSCASPPTVGRSDSARAASHRSSAPRSRSAPRAS